MQGRDSIHDRGAQEARVFILHLEMRQPRVCGEGCLSERAPHFQPRVPSHLGYSALQTALGAWGLKPASWGDDTGSLGLSAPLAFLPGDLARWRHFHPLRGEPS